MFQPAKLRSSSLLMQTSISLGTLGCIGVGDLDLSASLLFQCCRSPHSQAKLSYFLILNVQPLAVDKTDLRTEMEVMYRVMKSAAPFTSYVNWMDFLARKDVVVSREVKPGNANLRGEVIKAKLIEPLGRCKL